MAPRRAQVHTKPAPKKSASNPISARKSYSNKPVPAQKPIFLGKSICSIGVFKRNEKVVQHEDINKWVRLHGGEYVGEVTDSTTHLITSIEEFKKRGEQVQCALRLGKRRCHIVVYDWLEDCLLGVKLRKRLIPEKGYTLDRVMARIAQGKEYGIEWRKRFEEGVKAGKELVDNKLYLVYYDHDGFEYKVVLTRVTLGEKILTEKYTLYLFESIATPPKLYMVGAKLCRTHHPNSYWRSYCHPMPFDTAFAHFKHFFHEKTGVEWDMRLEPLPTKPKAKFTQDGILEEHVKFKYARPEKGRPVGLLPLGYILPEDRPVEASKESAGENGTSSGSDGDDSSRSGTEGGTDTSGRAYDSDSEVESGPEDDDAPAVRQSAPAHSFSARSASDSFRGGERAGSNSDLSSFRRERANSTRNSISAATATSTRENRFATARATEVIVTTDSNEDTTSDHHTQRSGENSTAIIISDSSGEE